MRRLSAHLILIAGAVFLMAPIVLIIASSTHPTSTLVRDGLQFWPGTAGIANYRSVLTLSAGFDNGVTVPAMLVNSAIVGLGVGVLTTALSLLIAYTVVFIRLPLAGWVFWIVLVTLLFPLEARFVNTFQVTSALGLINTHAGIVLPALALALGTFFYRQFFRTLPEELTEAAILDSAGPIRFLRDIVIPLSWSRTMAVFTIAFMIGWNQYLWPLMISTDDSLYTLVRGIRLIGQESGPGMAMVVISILPPLVLLLLVQRRLYTGLTDRPG